MENEDVVIVEIPPPIVKSPKIIKERGIVVSHRIGRGFSIEVCRKDIHSY
ncbi:MAG: hypothetical protein QXF79_01590 [Ignisphaera sp.]